MPLLPGDFSKKERAPERGEKTRGGRVQSKPHDQEKGFIISIRRSQEKGYRVSWESTSEGDRCFERENATRGEKNASTSSISL